MSTSPAARLAASSEVARRVLTEGYGPGAWHGPNLKAALDDLAPPLAYWRPGPERHNIAEIAMHHAFSVRAVRAQLSGRAAEPFVLEGEDWFDIPNETRLGWATILATVEEEQQRLATLLDDIDAGRVGSPLAEAERFDLVLGVTCHAVYHAGQAQLIKRLGARRAAGA
jgi:hypothetical protein